MSRTLPLLLTLTLLAPLTRAADAPPFRRPIVGHAFTDQLDDAADNLGDLDELAKSPIPTAGGRIVFVKPDGPAAKLGLRAGDVISAIDGQPLLLHDLKDFRQDHDQQMTVVTAGPAARTVTIQPGKVGFNVFPTLRPELLYLRSNKRDPKWDRYAVVGAALAYAKPELAETAWAHAIEAGYPRDALADYCGAQIAWRQGRNADALAFADALAARPEADVPELLRMDHLQYDIALANGQLQRAIDALQTTSVVLEPEPTRRRLADLLTADANADHPAPSDLVARNGVTSLLDTMEPRLEDNGNAPRDGYRRDVSKQLAQHRRLDYSAPTAHYNVIVQMPTVDAPAVEYVLRASMHPNDDQTSQYGKTLYVALVNCDDPDAVRVDARSSDFLHVVIGEVNELNVHQDEPHRLRVNLTTVDSAQETGARREFALRLLHTPARDEVWLNQRRLCLLPTLDHPTRVGFRLGVVGMAAKVQVAYSKINDDKK